MAQRARVPKFGDWDDESIAYSICFENAQKEKGFGLNVDSTNFQTCSPQRARVPKFGDWDDANIAYTMCFENARKEKGTGLKINPNDPEENPDAFEYAHARHQSDDVSYVAPTPFLAPNSDRMVPAAKHHVKERPKTPSREKGTRRHYSHQSISLDEQRSRKPRFSIPESGSEIGSFEYSLSHTSHHRARSAQRKSQVESSNSFDPSNTGLVGRRNRNHQGEVESHRSVGSLPKFGDWNERDPKSGEEFTIIFNKAIEEKKIGAATPSRMPSHPECYSNDDRKRHGSSFCRSLMCCSCLFPRGSC